MKPEIFCITAAAGLILMASAAAAEMPPLAKKLGCIACHAIDKKVVGPAWKDVAEKYTGHGIKKFKYNGKEYPLIEGLVMKVSKGGSGTLGRRAHAPNDAQGLHKAEITELVKFEQHLANR
jgi:cytochrome c